MRVPSEKCETNNSEVKNGFIRNVEHIKIRSSMYISIL